MAQSLGERLRQQRESRTIALATIAEQTKIKRSLLEALEKDDVSHWPPGIFRRSWVRSYAIAIGLDPDETVRQFIEQHPDPVAVEAAAAEAAAAAPAAPAGVRSIINSWLQRRAAAPEPAAPEPAATRALALTPVELSVAPVAATPVAATPVAATPVVATPIAGTPVAGAPGPDLEALARICRELGRVNSAKDIQALLGEASGVLDAKGMIVWVWDHRAEALRPAFVHGYEQQFVARLPTVGRDAHNLTAAAFRLAVPQEAESAESSALVVPLLLTPRCAGVLAIEFRPGHLMDDSTRAVAAILGAAVAQVVARAKAAQAQSRLASSTRPVAPPRPSHPGPH